jgi:arylsulfatase
MKQKFIKLLLALMVSAGAVFAQDKPNIVLVFMDLVFMDNFGWGEPGFNGGGITRGAPTPRLDKLSSEGIRLTNFNVESQCTPSRAAIMSGRYAIRTGNGTIPLGGGVYGLVQWEVTMAEMLSDAGYATGMFGKWHLGHTEGRFPTDQGFDEWYGIPNSSDETPWEVLDGYAESGVEGTYIYEGKKGSAPKRVMDYNLEQRALIDLELTKKSIDFMKRQVKAGKPFFLYVPYTMTHYPLIPHPDFAGKTGNGRFADVLAQIDAYNGMLLDAVDELGIRDNTLFIFTADNGPEALPEGSNTPSVEFQVTRVLGVVRCSPDSREACEYPLQRDGPVRFLLEASVTKSCTRWICTRRLPISPAARSLTTALSTVWIRPIFY